MKKYGVSSMIFLFVGILFTLTFIQTSQTHHSVTANADFSKSTLAFWTFYKAGGGVSAPVLNTDNEISKGWFRIKGYINGKGINKGWDYKARDDGFNYAKNTTKTVWGSNDDDEGISGYGDARITNQNDYAQDYDNELE
ncbi:MAG: hypothetical protein OXL96_19530 [Candidatus Poribacteria bacterium]|nr:hypothetical protein [Candidatus Poribacteria bacterium]